MAETGHPSRKVPWESESWGDAQARALHGVGAGCGRRINVGQIVFTSYVNGPDVSGDLPGLCAIPGAGSSGLRPGLEEGGRDGANSTSFALPLGPFLKFHGARTSAEPAGNFSRCDADTAHTSSFRPLPGSFCPDEVLPTHPHPHPQAT